MISSMLDPASRFSKTVATGVRVPRNTHAPLRLPGTLSTAGHCDQSRAAIACSSLLKNTPSKIPGCAHFIALDGAVDDPQRLQSLPVSQNVRSQKVGAQR